MINFLKYMTVFLQKLLFNKSFILIYFFNKFIFQSNTRKIVLEKYNNLMLFKISSLTLIYDRNNFSLYILIKQMPNKKYKLNLISN